MFDQGAGRREGVHASRSDRQQAFVRGDNVSLSGDEERVFFVGDYQQRFEMTQVFVCPPVFAQLDGGSFELSLELFELCFESCQKRKRIGGRPRKANQNISIVDPPYLASISFYDSLTQRHLTVAGHCYSTVTLDEKYSCGANPRIGQE